MKTGRILFLGVVLLLGAAVRGQRLVRGDSYVPPVVDYGDAEMWFRVRGDSTGLGADVFYIPSTWERDWYGPDSVVCHYADPSQVRHRGHMRIEMRRAARFMADGFNFYSPYYRHITLDTWATLDDVFIEGCFGGVAFRDVRAAFERYLREFNGGRPFILAGFSQGAKSVVELLKVLSPEARSRMVAAYVIGYKVTPADTAQCGFIRGAEGADDTGVTVCYNSVSDVRFIKPIVCEPCVMCINPVNWRTDGVPALLQDSITVTLHPDRRVLVVEGFDGSAYRPIMGFLNVGDYHGAELWLYSECLRENFKRRTAAFRERLSR
ncbi:MAG: DUF3089 domain-containing protein [Coprobacter sp.]|nr:DUF3089 domain-containing protein [Coprobacter sp.]